MPDLLDPPTPVRDPRPATTREPRGINAIISRLTRAVPPAVIFTVLGGLLFWGHRSEWELPKASALRGDTTPEHDDWCPEHSVPESKCVECHPELLPRPKAHGFCKLHGVHECPHCHPEVAQLDKRPDVTPADLDRAAKALAFAERPTNEKRCTLHLRRIQFESIHAVEKYGIGVEPVWTGPVVEAVSGSGEVVYDQTLTARLSARAPGTVFRAFKQVGDLVKQGEVVALVDAAEAGRAKAAFLQSLVQTRLETLNYDRMKNLAGSGVSKLEVDKAFAAVSEARINLSTAQQSLTNLGLPISSQAFEKVTNEDLPDRLRFHGIPKPVADTFDPRTTTGNLIPVVAPFDGVVSTRDVVAGEVVDQNKVLFVVVDPRRMWLLVDVRLEDAKGITVGTPIRFRPDGSKDEVSSAVTWVSTEAHSQTRTVKIRASLDNPDGWLKSNTFGSGRVILREEPKAIVVPTEAVHFEGCCHVVFVRDKNFFADDAPKLFHTRTVRIGAKNGQQTEIIVGVLPGELVAVKGSTVLKSELLKGNLGAGCDCSNK